MFWVYFIYLCKMTVIKDNRNYRVELKQDTYTEFESRLCTFHNDVLTLNSFKIQNYEGNGRNHDNELKVLIEKNKQLHQEIDTKLEELSRQKSQYEHYKQDQKLLSQEIKDTHEAFLMAKKYYKKFLKIYYTIESKDGDKQTIFLQFFTDTKKEYENYSVRLLRDTKTGCYELLETKPKLNTFEELKKMFLDTNDIPGALCCIRQAYIKIKKNKKPLS